MKVKTLLENKEIVYISVTDLFKELKIRTKIILTIDKDDELMKYDIEVPKSLSTKNRELIMKHLVLYLPTTVGNGSRALITLSLKWYQNFFKRITFRSLI